nr:tetratricopeptide repeat protein [Bathymodiolus thermophilus thioautotrophic gill symbiont]
MYRGQSEDYPGGVVSTASRRLKKSGFPNPSKEKYFEYHADLIKDARSYRYGQDSQLSDTGLLIDLQHYGAATGLIDFSEDFLIALWFACDNTNKTDGEVFFLNVQTNEFKPLDAQEEESKYSKSKKEELFTQEDQLYYLHTNFKSTARIFAQKGVFIFGYKKIDNIESIAIKESHKEAIRQELKQYFNIEEKNLFQDIYGFAQVNNTEHKYDIKIASDYFQEGYEEKNQEQKISLYQKAIEIDPNYYRAYYNIGTVYDELKEYQKAIDAYKEIIGIKPDYHFAHNNMGIDYNKLKEHQKAIDAYKEAIKIKPNHRAYYNMGIAYSKLKEYQKAIDAYKEAIRIKPDYHRACYSMGIAYSELKEYQKAIDAYKEAIRIKPDYHRACYNMGIAYSELKEYQKAIDAYKEAIRIKPDYHRAYSMGDAYNGLKEYQNAIDAYAKAIRNEPDLIAHSEKQNWRELETWVNNLPDSPTKQQNLSVLNQLKGN